MAVPTIILADGPQGTEQFSVDFAYPQQADVVAPRIMIHTHSPVDKIVHLVPRVASTGTQQHQAWVIRGQSSTGRAGWLICSDGNGVQVEYYSHEGQAGEPHRLQGREWTGIWIDEQLGPPAGLQSAMGISVGAAGQGVSERQYDHMRSHRLTCALQRTACIR